jgi:hypothetical protein
VAHPGQEYPPAAVRASNRRYAVPGKSDPLHGLRDDLEHGKADRAAKLAAAFLSPAAAGLAPRGEVLALLGKVQYSKAIERPAAETGWESFADTLREAQEAGTRDPDVPRLLALAGGPPAAKVGRRRQGRASCHAAAPLTGRLPREARIGYNLA